MAYTKTQWVNNQEPSINAENLNKMEQGIYDAQSSAKWGNITGTLSDQTDLNDALSALNNGLSQKVSSVNGETPDTNGNVQIDATDIETSSGVAIKSVSGNPVTIADALQGKALGVNTTLEPIQDLNGYDHPWAGGAGKNLFDFEGWLQSNNVSYTKSGNSFTFSSTTDLFGNPFSFSAENIDINFNVSVTLGTATNLGFVFLDKDGNVITGRKSSKTTVQGVSKVRMDWSVSGTVTITEPIISIDDVPFEPYSNICPISGRTQVDVTRTGENLLKTKDYLSWAPTLTKNADGSIKVVGSRTSSGAYAIGTVDLKANTNYVLSASGNDDLYYQMIASGSTVGTARLTDFAYTPTEDVTVTIRIFARANIDFNEVLYPQLELGTTATSYEQYNGQSVTVQLGQTVYGGTLDVTTGLLTVDKKLVDLGSLTWRTSVIQSLTRMLSNSIADIKHGTNNNYKANAISSCYTVSTVNTMYQVSKNGSFGVNSNAELMVLDTRYTDPSVFKTDMAGQTVCYELSTPQTIQLTPAQINLLTGTNIITTNADNLSVMYYATGKGDVEGSLSFLLDKSARNETGISSLAGSLAMIETSPATANHAVGSYLMLNNRLCKATSAIATGEQIIVGSNAQYTTVAEELTAILAQVNA